MQASKHTLETCVIILGKKSQTLSAKIVAKIAIAHDVKPTHHSLNNILLRSSFLVIYFFASYVFSIANEGFLNGFVKPA